MLNAKRFILSLTVICAAVSMAWSQGKLRVKPPEDPGSITCDEAVSVEVGNGVLALTCNEDKGTRKMRFNVAPDNAPSPEILVSFIVSYRMAYRQYQVLHNSNLHGPFKWPSRITIWYDVSKRITGIRYD